MKLNLHILKLSLIAASFAALPGHAADISVEAAVQSAYVDRGLKAADFTWFPSLEVSEGNFYAGVWAALPLEKKGSPNFFEDEVNVYAGYGWAISEKWALDVGGTYYALSGAEDSKEVYLGLFGELGTVSPAVYIYNDFDTDVVLLETSATVAIPLEVFPFEATGRFGLVDGDFDYSYFGVDLIYPVELGDSALLSLGVHYDDNDFGFGVPDSNFYASASVRLNF